MTSPQSEATNIDSVLDYAEFKYKNSPLLLLNVCESVLAQQPDNIRALRLIGLYCISIDNIRLLTELMHKTLCNLQESIDCRNMFQQLSAVKASNDLYFNITKLSEILSITLSRIHSRNALELRGRNRLKEAADSLLNSIEYDSANVEGYANLGKVLSEIISTYAKSGKISELLTLPLSRFESDNRTYRLHKIFSFDENTHSKQTVYLSESKLKPPVFSIVSPWGPAANNRRSYPLFYKTRNAVIQKTSHQLTIFHEEGSQIPTSYLPAITPTRENPFVSEDRSYALFSENIPDLTIEEPLVVIDSCLQCFAHFMHDYLPYILLAHSHEETRNCRILVPSINGTEERFLQYLNIPREKIITWPEMAAAYGFSGSIRIESAYFPLHLPLPVVIEVVRSAFKCAPDKHSDGSGRKIFISRKSSSNFECRIENESELSTALEHIGFETVAPELLPIDEQIRLFSEASIIVGAAGSGMFSQVWAPRDAAIIVLMSEENYKYALRETIGYQQVSACLGQTYFRLIYKSLFETEEGTFGATEVVYRSPEGERTLHVASVPYRCDPQEVARLAEFILNLQFRMASPLR
ncbi:MAG: glycosyltransferase family 61 protein [Desulfuromonadaceae bacterium]|nr:glycosyltransferase family 61 protein [Desulfuromonadaceae bacterium]MDD5104186.1 glycosyltransferase family 61 protein [Desulfuromonadaceae bacterium]